MTVSWQEHESECGQNFILLLSLFQAISTELTLVSPRARLRVIESRALLRVFDILQLEWLLHKKVIAPLFQVRSQCQRHNIENKENNITSRDAQEINYEICVDWPPMNVTRRPRGDRKVISCSQKIVKTKKIPETIAIIPQISLLIEIGTFTWAQHEI